ncbi:leucine--tRNA ligase [candidate division TA06 bacterium B3_TA06]|uniref:Leucine--tRNA ligase n=1 Tax=candidate division TA06 bacterium B3_TA06 TaxID=2012487 RepID=A0A532V601_UNCT6|nr:MAG: leucine--tRNA ligase [candidate division TA06 bacterium B3_TA06]
MKYSYKEIEAKWLKRWQEWKLYDTPVDPERKFYQLEMFLYTSGDIHIGHFRNYIIGDFMWRYKRMHGYQLLHPFGFDAFGLPAEEAAIKRGGSPRKWTETNIDTATETIKALGLSYDWSREVRTCDPRYYRWTQWLFIKLYEKGLAYRDTGLVNWCPACNTVLANEQVIGGKCWRCQAQVEKKELVQWYFKITDYAQRLLDNLDKLKDWPEPIKIMQRNWIGRSDGAELIFELKDNPQIKLPIFTTRPDTVYGVTFMAIAPEHKLVSKLLDRMPNKDKVKAYRDAALLKSEIERLAENREKDGVDTGLRVRNPFNNEDVQLWVADYVLASYGTGMVMAVPAHDQRDFEFAKRYGIPIKIVIQPPDSKLVLSEMEAAYVEPGVMVSSGPFDGISSVEGIRKVAEYAAEEGFGKPAVSYRLRDWLISRQRYWGAPIPMIHCPKCGMVPVPAEELPALLPDESKINFVPKARSPLESVPEFINVSCPKCGGNAKRDTDTMDTFVDSAWYHLRYVDPKNDKEIFSKAEAEKWLPIDLYIGGDEHATGHLIYFRFITMFLYDLGICPVQEPVIKLFNHGMVLDENGDVMSKSKGNAVSPRELIDRIGVDAARVAMLFFAPPGREVLWSEKGLKGSTRFLERVYSEITKSTTIQPEFFDRSTLEWPDDELYVAIERTVKQVSEDIGRMSYNTAVARMMEFMNRFSMLPLEPNAVVRYAVTKFVQILAPFAPFIAEELWEALGNNESIFESQWPEFDKEAVIEKVVEIPIQVNGKVRTVIAVHKGTSKDEIIAMARADDVVKKYLVAEPRKIIFVPDRLLNFVV